MEAKQKEAMIETDGKTTAAGAALAGAALAEGGDPRRDPREETAGPLGERVKDGVIDGLAGLADDLLLDEGGLARALAVCSKSVNRMVKRGELPPAVRLGNRRTWRVGRVRDYLERRMIDAEHKADAEHARLGRLGR